MKLRCRYDFVIEDKDGAWGDWPPIEMKNIRGFIVSGLQGIGVVAGDKKVTLHGGGTLHTSRVKEKKATK